MSWTAVKVGFLAIILFSAVQLFLPRLTISTVTFDFQRFHQLMGDEFGSRRVQLSRKWEDMLKEISNLPENKQVLRVNEFLHQHIEYATDIQIWGVEDYWATPLQTLGKGRGDCEDWAILQYFSLRITGIQDQKLRLIYVTAVLDTPQGPVTEPHMVLGYYPDPVSEPIILDNLISKVVPASQRTDLTPAFSFNSQGLWVGIQRNAQAGSTSSLSRWRDVLERVQEEGANW